MYKYIYPLIKWKIKPWLKYYIVKKGEGTPSEIITSASPITLVNSLRKKFIKFIVGGNSIQNGEPTPATPVEIQNVTGDVEVKVNSQNICTNVEVDQGKNNIIFYADVKLIKQTFNIAFTTNTALAGNSLYCSVDGQNLGLIKAITATANSKVNESITLSNEIYEKIQNATSLNFRIYKTNAGFVLPDDAQISNETITDYVPHEEQTVTFPLLEGQVLHEGDTIEDKIVQKRITIDLSTLTWNKATGTDSLGNTFGFSTRLDNIPKQNETQTNFALCNILRQQKRSDVTRIDTEGFYLGKNNILYVKIKQSLIPNGTVAELNTLLTDTNATLEYELETPIETPFTEAQATAKAQIDSLHSYKGTTHISSTNDPSPIFEVQYYMEGE